MKILSAYWNGAGQRPSARIQVPSPAQVVPKDHRPNMVVGQSIERLGNTISNIAEQQLATEQYQQRQLDDSSARSALFAHENDLNGLVSDLSADTSLQPQEKRDEFRKRSDELRGQYLDQIPERIRPSFLPTFAQQLYQSTDKLDGAVQKQVTDTIRSQGNDARNNLINSNRTLEDKLQILADPDAWDWDAEGLSDTQRHAEIERLAEEATGADIERRMNSEDPRQVLTDLRATTGKDGEQGDYINYSWLPPKTRQAYTRAARTAIDAQDREAERQKREAAAARDNAAKEAFGQYKTQREGLFPIDPAFEAAMWKAVGGTEYEQKAREIRKQTGGLDFVSSKIKTDPLKYGGAQLGLDVPPLSVDSPDQWPAQFAARFQVADVIRKAHGLPYSPILTNAEADGLSGLLKMQSPQAQVATINLLAQATDKETIGRMAGQFAATDRETGAVVELIARGKQQAAYHVANGRALLESKGASLPKMVSDDIRSKFNNELDDALAGMPQARETLLRSSELAYLSLRGSNAVIDDSLDSDTYEKALQMVAGETAKVNGKRVLLPDGMKAEQFLDAFDSINEQHIESAGGVMGFTNAADAAEDIIDDAEPYETGTGRFRFVIDGRFLARADDPSRYFELDLSKLQYGKSGGW